MIVLLLELGALESTRKPDRTSSADVTSVSAAQTSDVNISAVSGTPGSDVADTATTRRTRRNAPSMPSLVEVPLPAEILPPLDDNDEQMVLTSSNEETVRPTSSNQAMVSCGILVYV